MGEGRWLLSTLAGADLSPWQQRLVLPTSRGREAAPSRFFLIPKSLSSCDSQLLQFLHLLIQFPEENPSALLPRLLELTSKTIFDLNLAAKTLSFVEANPLSVRLPAVTAEVCLQSLLTDPGAERSILVSWPGFPFLPQCSVPIVTLAVVG